MSARVADVHCAVLVLAEYPWSKDVHDYTGFTVHTLTQCVLHLHKKWWVQNFSMIRYCLQV